MAETKCIRCHEGAYAEVDRETDFQGREFMLLECNQCHSLVIRKSDWDPAWRIS
ncbi:MAG: hypothetical protein ACYTHM_21480 [Planctomycetota bacterium]|jgi:nitrate/TMAO reductase-like tetraheme cytochrome c subunit